jgi:hypothetical protein
MAFALLTFRVCRLILNDKKSCAQVIATINLNKQRLV